MADEKDLKWKHILIRVLCEFLLDKLPEILTIVLHKLGANPGSQAQDRDDKGDTK